MQSAVATAPSIRSNARPARNVPGSWKTRPTGTRATLRLPRLRPRAASRAAPVRRGISAGPGWLTPSGKDQHRLARPEVGGRGGKHRPVARGVGAPLLAAVDGQRAHQTQEGADERVAEPWRLGNRHQPAREQPQQERVDQRVLVVGRHDQGPDSGMFSRPTRSMRRWNRPRTYRARVRTKPG